MVKTDAQVAGSRHLVLQHTHSSDSNQGHVGFITAPPHAFLLARIAPLTALPTATLNRRLCRSESRRTRLSLLRRVRAAERMVEGEARGIPDESRSREGRASENRHWSATVVRHHGAPDQATHLLPSNRSPLLTSFRTLFSIRTLFNRRYAAASGFWFETGKLRSLVVVLYCEYCSGARVCHTL